MKKAFQRFALLGLALVSARGEDTVRARLEAVGSQATLEWDASMRLPFAASFSEYFIHRSADLQNWSVVAGPIRGDAGVGEDRVRRAMGERVSGAFYRVSARTQPGEPIANGEGMLGFGDVFNEELRAIGQISTEEFLRRHPAPAYLDAITFDPTTADYWSAFNADPAPLGRYTDFRLNAAELEAFRNNALVVSPRLGGYSFADVFYKIYTDDLPVFISTDAMLHAWHRTFVAMLSEIEETYLAPRLQTILRAMAEQVPALAAEAAGTPLEHGVRHADVYLAVAESLLTGTTSAGSLGQGNDIGMLLGNITALQPNNTEIFGANRLIDYSQFAVRGHYDLSPLLSQYFRTVMWLGLMDLRIIEGGTRIIYRPPFPPRVLGSYWEFAGIAALNTLLDRGNVRDQWNEVNAVLGHLMGQPDGMDFSQIDPILRAVNFGPPYSQLQEAYDRIMAGTLGAQEIMGGPFRSPFSAEQIKLPRSFAFLPRRFIMDSWAMGKVVLDRIIWDEDGIPNVQDKVQRRIPSGLDVVFAALGNDQVAEEIARRISDRQGVAWRDGYFYQHNLTAARNTIDRQNEGVWSANVYAAWLKCLRMLSGPTTGAEYPDAMRTRAWAMKTANTQLASWTQLRHDTILYGKQSYTPQMGCSYPKGFVEPRVEFWEAMIEMVAKQRAVALQLDVTWPPGISGTVLSTEAVRERRLATLDAFIATLTRLREISRKELSGEEFSAEDLEFLDGAMERRAGYGIGERSYSGWYPSLFYRNIRQQFPYGTNQGSDYWDAIATDVHTAVPDPAFGFDGMVLHEAVGNVHLAMLAVNCRDGARNVYAGPVMSYYEFQRGPTTRLTDAQWKAEIRNVGLPPSPDWTRSYLVPGAYTVPALPAGF